MIKVHIIIIYTNIFCQYIMWRLQCYGIVNFKRYWSIDLTSGSIVYAIIILLVPSHQRKLCCQTHHFYNISCHVFWPRLFKFSQHFPCFLFIIKKYCKLLEHLVWFVVSRIRLCILTEFCFKTLRQVITQHNPFTFYFQFIP